MHSIDPELQTRAGTALMALLNARRTKQEWRLLHRNVEALDEAFQQGDAAAFAQCYADLSRSSEATSSYGVAAYTATVAERDPTEVDDPDDFRVRGVNTWNREKDQAVQPPEEIYELINKMVHALVGVNPTPHGHESEKPEHDAQ